jgi:glycosyltransferase involved in cell wall biosynthesis
MTGSNGRMAVTLVFPYLPPALDGIGDHTARLAEALAPHASVRVITARSSSDPEPIPGVEIQRAFGVERRRETSELVRAVEANQPDWLLLQFNQFSYGRWGLNPYLPLALQSIRKRCPRVRVAWFAHEDFVPPTSARFMVMRTWQRAQFRALGRLSDLVLFTIAPWADRYRSWFPDATVEYLPVGSNVPDAGTDYREARARLGIQSSTLVVGVFGTIGIPKPVAYLREAAQAIAARFPDSVVLYVGPHGAILQSALSDMPLIDAGALSAEGVSSNLAAMDLHLTPFIDGVSTRRGSFMAGLQHGVPSVTTLGVHSDHVLRRASGAAFAASPAGDAAAFAARSAALAGDEELRGAMRPAARRLYDEEFAFERASARLMAMLEKVSPRRPR